MPVTVRDASGQSVELNNNYSMDKIGIEFEFPVANNESNYPACSARNSGALQRVLGGRGTNMSRYDMSGTVGSDHVGAEITTSILPLHSDDPIEWYEGVIDLAADHGFPFAACGSGDDNYGLHLHLSSVPHDLAREIDAMCFEPWGRIFFCSSVRPTNLEPWRHGGVSFGDGTQDWPRRSRNGLPYGRMMTYGYPDNTEGHYEFRLPEPMKPEHLELVLEFLRTAEIGGAEAAREFALRHVEQRNTDLTPIDQYLTIQNRRDDDWPNESAMCCQRRRNRGTFCSESCRESAEFLVDLMGDEV